MGQQFFIFPMTLDQREPSIRRGAGAGSDEILARARARAFAGSDIGQHAHLDDKSSRRMGKAGALSRRRRLVGQFVTELAVEALNGGQSVQTDRERKEGAAEGGKAERKRQEQRTRPGCESR